MAAPSSASSAVKAASCTSKAPTNQPFPANSRAVSRPMPEAAPVMKIDLRPLSLDMVFLPIVSLEEV